MSRVSGEHKPVPNEPGRSERAGPALPHEGWNYRVLFAQGVADSLGHVLASRQLVLPYLLISLGGPAWAAATLLPVSRTSGLIAQIIALPVVQAADVRKWYLVTGTLLKGTCIAAIGFFGADFASASSAGIALSALFLGSALLLGAGQGLASLAYHDLLPRLLGERLRGANLFYVESVAGLMVIACAWAIPRLTDTSGSIASHFDLLWAGVTAVFAAAAICVLLRDPGLPEAAVDAPGRDTGYLGVLRNGLTAAGRMPWFRRFLAQRVLLQSVELSLPFYSIHAATLHQAQFGSLSALVIASGGGAIAGGLLWRRVSAISDVLTMTLACLSAMLGGLLALTLDRLGDESSVIAYSVVVFLVVMAIKGSSISRVLYLARMSSSAERPFLVTAGNVVGDVAGVFVALGFGLLGHFHSVTLPLLLIVGLNLLAGLCTARLERPRRG